jgi:hypothetical protein
MPALKWKKTDRRTWKAATPAVGGRYVIERLMTAEEAYDIRHYWGRRPSNYDYVSPPTAATLDEAKAIASDHDRTAIAIAAE